jgi:hypothetical protein
VRGVVVTFLLVGAAACSGSGVRWTSIDPGDLPADVPPTCSGNVYYEQNQVLQPLLCNGLPVWFGCGQNTYTQYTCSSPGGYSVEGMYPDPGDPNDTVIAPPPDAGATDGSAG